MRLARESRYAIEALLVIEQHGRGGFVPASEIGTEAGLPLAYLRKILRALVTGEVLVSRRGQGYALARPAEGISVGDVIAAVEGGSVFENRCIFWREECSTEDPCELHFRWKDLKPAIETWIAGTTLADVVAAEAMRSTG